MSYHVVFHNAEKKANQEHQHQHQHCMRCHKSFDPDKNSSTACVLLTPHPFMGHHTTNAKEVDYATKFDICDPSKCGKVLHSFTFHLRLIQAERESLALEREMDLQDEQYDKALQDQLEFLQKLKLRRAKMMMMTPQEHQRNNELNPKRVQAVDQQYKEVVERMIQREKEKMDLETWTREVLDPSYNQKEEELFLKAPRAEPKARETWARIQQAAVGKKDDSARRSHNVKPTAKDSRSSNSPLKKIRESKRTLNTIRE